MYQTVLFLLLVLCAVVQAVFLMNRHFLIRGMLFSAVSGLLCLVAVGALGGKIGVFLPLTVPTAAVSGVLGVPGCIFLLFSKLICGV